MSSPSSTSWSRVACAVAESRKLKIVRFGGMNMREVAVTGGDRVRGGDQVRLVDNGHAVGDLVARIAEVRDARGRAAGRGVRGASTRWFRRCGGAASSARTCATPPGRRSACARFLTSGGYGAFTTTFEDLYGLNQLPGLACQRLMADGYGFGAEGDWKTAALVRLMKVMSAGRKGGVSFMEDYTYHLVKGEETVLGAHMLEVCPSIADGKPSLEVHPLGIGGKGGPLPAGLQRRAGTGGRRVARRHGRADAADRAGGGRGQGRARDAEAAGGARALGAAARFPARLSGLAARRRRAPHLVQPGGHRRAAGRPGRACWASSTCASGTTPISRQLKKELRWNDRMARR